jgi:hypothetical protein
MFDNHVHTRYNDSGKGFEELFAEGIKQINFQAIQKQIINSKATENKECAKDE